MYLLLHDCIFLRTFRIETVIAVRPGKLRRKGSECVEQDPRDYYHVVHHYEQHDHQRAVTETVKARCHATESFYRPESGILAHTKFQIEYRHAHGNQHDDERYEESPCREQNRTREFYNCRVFN